MKAAGMSIAQSPPRNRVRVASIARGFDSRSGSSVCPVHGCTNPTCAAASRLMKPVPADAEWVTFCKRTEDPKLAWIEHQLDLLGLPHKRDGSSFHASHVLKVLASDEEQANTVLMRRIGRYTVDDVRDDHPRWTRELGLDNSLRM
ncbi:unnamed protein product [Sphagnum tenellum]